ncbi:uncharacterized protein LOC130748458 [Lotus japonicus]|uniref:uncharacterized protein LOC130748458 n=1 Tax=Lotus japonicus TaxID=34305 RepID=UPI002588721D|nr:uncharacterized protein LOC130748458 [Lotus japonicus]
MGLLVRSLAVLVLVLLWCHSFPHVRAQSSSQAKSLDVILQEYAYRGLGKPKTGTVYDGTQLLPSNLTGVKVAALRLRSGSLRRYGVAVYNEFQIPEGIIVSPYVKRIVLVYQNLGKLSTRYYPLPNYTYLAPVLGLLAYDASDLSATGLPELHITASRDPVKVKFQDVKAAPHGAVAKCVWFDLQGSSNFSNVTGGDTCSTSRQGHYSIVVESTAPSPVPAPTPVPSAKKESKSNKKVWIIVGSVLGGLLLLVLLYLLIVWVVKYMRNKKIQQMERSADMGEALHMASVGDTKAPAATVTRTQPTLEHEYAP